MQFIEHKNYSYQQKRYMQVIYWVIYYYCTTKEYYNLYFRNYEAVV